MRTHTHTQVWGGTSFIPSLHPDLCLCVDFTRDLTPSGPTERRNYRRQTALRGQILSILNQSTLGKTWDGVTLTSSPSCVPQTPQVSWTELHKGSPLGSARPGWILTHEVTQKQVAPTVKKRFLHNPTPTPLLHSGPRKFQLTFKLPPTCLRGGSLGSLCLEPCFFLSQHSFQWLPCFSVTLITSSMNSLRAEQAPWSPLQPPRPPVQCTT